MADVNISKYRASVVRDGSKPASPGFVVSEGQDPVNPPGTNNFVPYTGATANVELGEFGVEAGFVTLDTTPTNIPTDQGAIYWDDTRSTAALIMNGTLQHIGQDSFFYVKNSSGSTIPKGTCVGFAGTDGGSGHLLITPFLANGSVPSTYFMGVTSEEIANGSFGQVMHFGELEGINTTGFTAGALLYASSTVAGAFQITAPVAPNNIILVAAAVNSKNNGAIVVRPTLGSNINTDEGIKITSPTTGDLLQLQAGGLWENKTLAQVIGSAYVPSTRTLTINGTAFDLSANRSWTVGDVRTDGSYSNPSWITALAWSKITETPTTLSGYGITDAVPNSRTITINGVTQDLSANRSFNVGTVTSVGLSSATSGVTIGSTPVTSSGTITLAIATATATQNGLLSSTDWTTFNNKQNALTNPVTGAGTTNYLAKFTGSTTVGNSQVFDNGTNVGIGTASPSEKLDVIGVLRNLMPSDPLSGMITAKFLSFSPNPYGIHFRGYASGVHSIQVQREGNNSELFGLSLQPLGGNVLIGTTSDNGARLQVNGAGVAFSFTTPNGLIGNINSSAANGGYVTWQTNGTTIADIGTAQQIFGSGGNDTFGINGRGARALAFGTNNIERMRITSDGNVSTGNGHTFTSWSNTGNIDLNDVYLSLSSSGSYGGIVANNAYFNSGWKYKAANNATLYQTLGGEHRFLTAGVGSGAGAAISFTQAMTLTSGGNLAVGDTATTTLSGYQWIRINGSTGSVLELTSASSRVLQIQADGTSAGAQIQTITGSPLIFGTGATERARITSGGNLLVGTTTDAGFRMAINGPDGTSYVKFTSTAAATGGRIGYNGNEMRIDQQENANLIFRTNGNTQMTITSSGNVGIGTSSPAARLHTVADTNSDDTAAIIEGTGGLGSGLHLRASGTSGRTWRVISTGTSSIPGAGNLGFYDTTAASYRMVINTSGNVGIGTSSPFARLHVRNSDVNEGTIAIGNDNYPGLIYSNAFTGEFRIDNRSSAGAGYITFFPNGQQNTLGNEAMRIATSRNVLIGTTTDVGARLHVNGDVRTAAPTGGSAVNWRLGTARAGTITPNATVRVEIGGVLVDLDARYV